MFTQLYTLLSHAGVTSIADRKLECGASLIVLGMHVIPSSVGVKFELSAEKAEKYIMVIRRALESGYLSSGTLCILRCLSWRGLSVAQVIQLSWLGG